MKEELLLKLIEKLLESESSTLPTSTEMQTNKKEMIGDYVIVRCRDAGVHAGYLVDYEGREVVLKDSRRLWYWKCANNQHSLSGVANEGITSDSKIPAVIEKAVLPEACEILSTTNKAKKSIEGAEVYVH